MDQNAISEYTFHNVRLWNDEEEEGEEKLVRVGNDSKKLQCVSI